MAEWPANVLLANAEERSRLTVDQLDGADRVHQQLSSRAHLQRRVMHLSLEGDLRLRSPHFAEGSG